MLMPKVVTWVVIADGARARIVRQIRAGRALEALPEHAFANPAPQRTRELGTDRPGRTADSSRVGHRHGLEQVDWHRYEKKKFARSIAGRLEQAAEAGAFDRLVLAAPPETLGELRANLGKHGQARIAGTVAKDLTQIPIDALPPHLDGAVKVVAPKRRNPAA